MTRIRFDGCDLSRDGGTPVLPVYEPGAPGTKQWMAEPITTPRELLAAYLRQMLWIERRLAEDVLPRLREAAHSPDLRRGFDRHLVETEAHVSAIRDVLGDLQAPILAEESPGFRGLLQEHERLVGRVSEDDHLLTDLAHAVAALATEHLELATYESLVSVAESIGEDEVGIRLREVMEQEEFALEQVEGAMAKLLAEKVESARL
jgi:ferritin-like metal-binding protein YciE